MEHNTHKLLTLFWNYFLATNSRQTMILVSRKIWSETPMNKVDHKLTKRLNTAVIGQRNERIVCARRSERVYFGYKTIAVTNTARAAALCRFPSVLLVAYCYVLHRD